MLKKMGILLGGMLLLGVLSESAQAQCSCGHGPLSHHPSAFRTGGRVAVPNPPYFAMHPPVYYNRVVPRAYGFSPHAAPAGVVPAENSVLPVPETVKNPFYKPERPVAAKGPVTRKSTTTSQTTHANTKSPRVINPFYFEKVLTTSIKR